MITGSDKTKIDYLDLSEDSKTSPIMKRLYVIASIMLELFSLSATIQIVQLIGAIAATISAILYLINTYREHKKKYKSAVKKLNRKKGTIL